MMQDNKGGADKGHILMGLGRDGKYVGRGREGGGKVVV